MPRIPGLRRLFRFPTPTASRVAVDVDDELRFHLDERASDLVAEGASPADAHAQARHEFGDVERARTALVDAGRGQARRTRGRMSAGELARDLRLAGRSLYRAPAFTLVAALTLALGVGANATMLGLVDRLLLRPPAGVVDPDRVVRVYGRNYWTALTRSYADYVDLRDHARGLAAVGAYQTAEATVRQPERVAVRLERTTASLLPLLGARPRLGRGFTADEDGGAGARVVVLSDALWRRLFAADPAALGRDVVIGREAYRIVGVAAPGFRGVHPEPADAWTPLGELPRDRGNYGAVHVVARLRPGIDLAVADHEANRVNRAGYVADGLKQDEDAMQLGPLSVTQGPGAPREVRVALWLAAVAGLVLVIAGANVAHLLVARALAREGETTVRFALGASRGRLVRQSVAEGLLLGALAGGAALLVVVLAGSALGRLVLPGAGVDGAVGVDGRTIGAVAILAAVMGLTCSVAPALLTGRRDLARGLAGRRNGSRGRTRLRATLLATQVALTGALLVGAGLFARSLLNVRAVDLGADVDRLLVVHLNGQDAGLGEPATDTVLRRMAGRARTLPGVEAVSLAHSVPFVSSWRTRLYLPGRDPERMAEEGGGRFNRLSTFVGPEYARAVGLRLLAGRWIDASDRAAAPLVVVVNDLLAGELWPAAPLASAVGQCVRIVTADAPCARVVGVVRAARMEGVFDAPPSQYYLPIDQPRRGEGATALLVRASGDPARLAELVRRTLQPFAPPAVDAVARPLSEAVDPVRRPWMLGATVFGWFGALALAVAAAGLYGVVALTVAERTRELGVRRALGARPADLARVVGARVWRVVAAGLVLGLALGWGGSRAAAGLLYGVRPLDPAAYAGAALLLAVVALAAGAIPVRRASRADPLAALRNE